MIEEAEAAEERRHLIAASYTAWQMGAGKKGKSFGNHLKTLGLGEKGAPLTKRERRQAAKAAIKKSKMIMMHDRKRKK